MMLSIRDLTIKYSTPGGELEALTSVSIDIERGTTLALVGESGSGKSTIALSAMGILPSEANIASGQIIFDGKDLMALTPSERRNIRGTRMAMVFQDPFSVLNPSLPIGSQVSEVLVYKLGFTKSLAEKRAIELLHEVGIKNPKQVAQSYPHQLSGGMRQRAVIAGALASNPELLILDEPTTALDVTIEAQILDMLERLREQHKLTMLFISHNLGVVKRIANQCAVLYAGQIIEEGHTRDIINQPFHPYTKGLIAAIPRLGERKKQLASIAGRIPDLRHPPHHCRFLSRCPFKSDSCDNGQYIIMHGGRRVLCSKVDEVSNKIWFDGAPSTTHSGSDPQQKIHEEIVSTKGLYKKYTIGYGHWHIKGFLPKRQPITITPINDITLTIEAGEALGLVGESGSGKTTLGRALLRLVDSNQGTIIINGQDITKISQKELMPIRKIAQIVFQNPDSSLNPRKTIRDLICRPLVHFGISQASDAPQKAKYLLDLVRLPYHYLDRYAHQMSGGEKQRVGIAIALATNPKFIVCDEPVSALDVSVQAAIVNLLAELRDRLGVAYLFISHDISVVAHLCDRIAVMQNGKIVELGRTERVINAPQNDYTKKLISSVPRI